MIVAEGDWLENMWQAIFESERLNAVTDYAQRGRAFRSLDTGELKSRWIVSMKKWAAEPKLRSPHRAELGDLEAEMSLRNEDPPFDQVREEMDAIKEAAAKVAAEI